MVSSSDEEEEGQTPPPPPPPVQQHQHPNQLEDIEDLIIGDMDTDFQTVTLNSSNPTPNSRNSATSAHTFGHERRAPEPIPIDISDEGEENAINNESADNSNFDNANGGTSYFEVLDSPVHEVLEGLGLRLRREWLESCLRGLQSSITGFQGMDDSAKAKL